MDTKAAFEKWFEAVEAGDDENWQVPKYLSPEWNQYMFRHQLALGAWQASREAIEIELPEEKPYKHNSYPEARAQDEGFNDALSECSAIITSHGIRIKGKTE